MARITENANAYKGGRLCACGCGQQAKKCFDQSGRFKCYCKYAENHRPRGATPKQIEAGIKKRGMSHPRSQPMFSKRIHRASDNLPYYVIKVRPSGRWMYEHRYLYEQFLGHKLLPGEIVHHLNDNTLDNRIDNMKLMSNSEHSTFHHSGNTNHQHNGRKLKNGEWSEKFSKCIVCGLTTSPHASRGTCARCNEYFRRNQRYK